MDLAEAAVLARIAGDRSSFLELTIEALSYEMRAIRELQSDEEPLFSLLHRSAATLALDCDRVREAEKLTATALAKEPPDSIADELRELWERANFHRHLRVRGIELGDNEIQMSLSGPGVGSGLIEQSEYHTRITSFGDMLVRTAERLARRAFRERGPVPKAIKKRYPVFVSAARAGSVTATLRVGSPVGEQYLDGMVNTRAVIDEVVDVLEVINDKNAEELKARIPEVDYRQNFVALATQIAPNDKSVHLVGLTAFSGPATRTVRITRTHNEIATVAGDHIQIGRGEVSFCISGTLRFADATSGDNTIKVVEENGKPHLVIVPAGLMNDIVRPHWNNVVQIGGVERNGKKELRDIAPVERE